MLHRSIAAAVWFVALVVLAAARGLVLWLLDPHQQAVLPRSRRWLVVAGAALFGALFGAFTLAAAPSLSAIQFTLMALFASAFSSVAMTSLVASRAAYFAYSLPMLGAVAISAALHPRPTLGE